MDIGNIQPLYAEHSLQALPPAAEEERRKQAIMNDPTFQERIGNDAYEIHTADMSTFWVITENYTFRVDVEIIPLEKILGPGTIVLHFGEIVLK